MKNTLVLLALLSVQALEVCSQPYEVDADGNCRDRNEYRVDDSNRCCRKCPPGHRRIQECSETNDTVCQQCEGGQYLEHWNYAQNCFRCNKCKASKGLQYGQNCSSTTKASCVCQPGMYCIMDFNDPHCTACKKYSLCGAGYGISVAGTANSDVKCKQCADGTFSDTLSYTDPCRPHTACDGKAVVRQGNSTSDTVCEHTVTPTQPASATKGNGGAIVFTSARTMRSTVLAVLNSTMSVGPSVSQEAFNPLTKRLPTPTESGIKLVAAIAGFSGFILLVIVLLMCLYKTVWKKDAAKCPPKLDANGNCESDDKQISQDTTLTITLAEQQCLLEKAGTCGVPDSQPSYTVEPLIGTKGGSSHESISSLQSTAALNNSCCALSEPLTLISDAEPVTPRPSVPPQPSSQPTSPHTLSPVTPSSQVNVNITFHIGNGSCGTPSVMPANVTESDCQLPFGEEEESFSIPQQEDGKQSLISTQDTAEYEE